MNALIEKFSFLIGRQFLKEAQIMRKLAMHDYTLIDIDKSPESFAISFRKKGTTDRYKATFERENNRWSLLSIEKEV